MREYTNQIQRGTNESTQASLTQRDNSQEKQRLQQQYMKTCSCVNNVRYIQQRVEFAVNNMRKTGSTSRWMMAPTRLPSVGKVP